MQPLSAGPCLLAVSDYRGGASAPRLSYHASIVIYSGNNENEVMAEGETAATIDYSALYDATVRATIASVDRSRPYWPASPSNGAVVDEPDRGLYVQRWGNPQDSRFGDVHTYPFFNTNFDCEELVRYPTSRFVSEYGFIALPSFGELVEVTKPGDWAWNSTQMFFRMRQSWPSGQAILWHQLTLHFRAQPVPSSAEHFRDTIYLSQATHAHCLDIASRHYRVQRSGGAHTMGLLFWSLNNQCQGQSDSSIDYSGRWKLLHHAAARFYAPVILALVKPAPGVDGGPLTIAVANDDPYALNGNVTLELRKWAAKAETPPLRVWSLPARVVSRSSVNVTQLGWPALLGEHAASDVYVHGAWKYASDDGAQRGVATNVYFPTKVRDAGLVDPSLAVTVEEDTDGVVVVSVSARAAAPHVFLDAGRLAGHFDDNGFFLLPGDARRIAWRNDAPCSVTQMRAELVVRTPFIAARPGDGLLHV